MAQVIHTVNREHLDSPPDLISPIGAKTKFFENNSKSEPRPSEIPRGENDELADKITNELLSYILQEFQ